MFRMMDFVRENWPLLLILAFMAWVTYVVRGFRRPDSDAHRNAEHKHG